MAKRRPLKSVFLVALANQDHDVSQLQLAESGSTAAASAATLVLSHTSSLLIPSVTVFAAGIQVGIMASSTVQDAVSDAKKLAHRLKKYDAASDSLLAKAQTLEKTVDSIKEVSVLASSA